MQPPVVPPRYLRIHEAAMFLGLSPRTLEKHRTLWNRPDLPHARRSGRLCDRRSATMGGFGDSEFNIRSERQNGPTGLATTSDNLPEGPSTDRARGHSVEKHPRPRVRCRISC